MCIYIYIYIYVYYICYIYPYTQRRSSDAAGLRASAEGLPSASGTDPQQATSPGHSFSGGAPPQTLWLRAEACGVRPHAPTPTYPPAHPVPFNNIHMYTDIDIYIYIYIYILIYV